MGLWWLMVAHTAYLLFMHFLSFHQATPELKLLQSWFAGPAVPVLGLRPAAYLRIVGTKRIAEPPREGANHAPV
ncbi:MAG: hypothetical protein DI533_06350 [Cereibacter sphaeroides]|uniref:Uncharacterized protein n=1 Tax=Cereibacter sphaeroides TaxID=1063 RepID=A0A2W5UQZ2_CERSP|nr:MAG: hypothetical protein DI533_06350 [Cereibacter sphaeroides]